MGDLKNQCCCFVVAIGGGDVVDADGVVVAVVDDGVFRVFVVVLAALSGGFDVAFMDYGVFLLTFFNPKFCILKGSTKVQYPVFY